jgi:glucokinase
MARKIDTVIALDIGGTNMRAAIVNRRGEILFSVKEPTLRTASREKAIEQIASLISRCAKSQSSKPSAVCIGFPGPLDSERGFIYDPPNLPAFKNTPLKNILEKKLHVAVFVENDANAAAFGEFIYGAGKGAASLVCLTLGTGIGGGIVLDGKIWHGAGNVAGEIGHITVMPDGRRCGCGARGCLEQYASATGVVHTARIRLRGRRNSLILRIAGGDLRNVTALTVCQAARRGDALAAEILEDAAYWLGIGIGDVINILNPEVVVIAGGVANAGKHLFAPFHREIKKHAMPSALRNTRIEKSKLDDRAGILGAAAVAFSRFL